MWLRCYLDKCCERTWLWSALPANHGISSHKKSRLSSSEVLHCALRATIQPWAQVKYSHSPISSTSLPLTPKQHLAPLLAQLLLPPQKVEEFIVEPIVHILRKRNAHPSPSPQPLSSQCLQLRIADGAPLVEPVVE
jgi:hypothetical protein